MSHEQDGKDKSAETTAQNELNDGASVSDLHAAQGASINGGNALRSDFAACAEEGDLSGKSAAKHASTEKNPMDKKSRRKLRLGFVAV